MTYDYFRVAYYLIVKQIAWLNAVNDVIFLFFTLSRDKGYGFMEVGVKFLANSFHTL